MFIQPAFMKRLLTVVLLFLCATVSGQGNDFWKPIDESEIPAKELRTDMPERYRSYRLDFKGIKDYLLNAPAEQFPSVPSGFLIKLPSPDGSMLEYRIESYEMLERGLQLKFPAIRTFQGYCVSDPYVRVKFDHTVLGFHVMVFTTDGIFFIDPFTVGDTSNYICYNKRDILPQQPFYCGNTMDTAAIYNRAGTGNQLLRSAGTVLRRYRLAVGCTGEYAAFFGGTVAGAMSGIVTSVNRVNGVYEQELAIRMVLVANNNLVVYTNASTDPYTNNNGSTMLGQNQTTLDNVIGSANYDIGHVFSTGGGGVASLRSPCTTSKARGVTGRGSPTGDAFDIDYVAHEMGHQFGGNHTFNGSQGSCSGGNRNSSTAYEVGSGTTIQAYAGICGTDNIQPNSDAIFHTISFDEMRSFVETGSGNTCGTNISSGNNPPTCNGGANYTIPISTPFIMTGSGTDPDGDVVTYLWEEFDLGPAGAPNISTNTTAPIFRDFVPVKVPSRTFPQLTDILNNTTTLGEILPSVARTLKFRMTVRDNRFGGGGVTHHDDTIKITVANNGAPFLVTSPNTAVTLPAGSVQTVTWNVSNTTASPINCSLVNILLSLDGGYNFTITLASATANDGSESITLPNVNTTKARIKVESVGNIFFDISNSNFNISNGASVSGITTEPVASALCAGGAITVNFTLNGAANSGNTFTAQLSNSAGSFASPVNIGTLSGTASGSISAVIPAGTAGGTGYRIRVIASNPSVTGSDNGSDLIVTPRPLAAGAITGTASVCQGQLNVTYSVGAITNASWYNWTLPPGAIFSGTTYTNSITVSYTGAAINGNITVAGANGCSVGTSSSFAVTLASLPASAGAITGSSTVCAGLSGVVYSVPAIANATGYSWTVPSGATIVSGNNTNSITVNYSAGASSGTITVFGSNACGNGSGSSLIVAVSAVPPAPTVNANSGTTFCLGGSVVLSFTPSAGYTYQWRKDGVAIPGQTGTSYTATSAGSYDVIATENAVASQSLSNTSRVFIPDNSCTGATSTINVTGYSTSLNSSSITMQLNITHTYDGDLAIMLVAPGGQVLGLANRVGSNGDNFTNTVFSDAAASALPSTGAPYTGTFKPSTATFTQCTTTTVTTFSAIGGGTINPNGTWSLLVFDRATSDTGSVQNWTLNLPAGGSACPAVSNAILVTIAGTPVVSSFSPSTGAPGTSVVISGSNFSGATAVTFNGVSASFTVNSPTQITATVPSGATNGPIQVSNASCSGVSASSFLLSVNPVLSLRILIQGFHTGGGSMNTLFGSYCDSVAVSLASSVSPYGIVQTVKQTVNATGNGTFPFTSVTPGSYYLVIRHRNTVETWSSLPVSISGPSFSYDFTTGSGKAYGNNMSSLGGGLYGLYSGDVDQNGQVDMNDVFNVESAAYSFFPGYVEMDLTGDFLVESTDFSIVENNMSSNISVSKP